MFNNKTILITGGTGSFGKKFTEILLKRYKVKKVIIYSRDEFKQFNLKNLELYKKYSKNIRFFVGDVRDKERLVTVTKNVDYIVHAAALKQVETSEYNPEEFIKTNIIGAMNIAQASIENKVKKVIALSTDKAVSPVNLYGATKLCSDKLFVASNDYYGGEKTQFSVVRYGNVLASRGSVVPFFKSINKNKEFPITDRKMTRFNIILDDAAQFVFNCFKVMQGREIFVPKIKSYRILDVLNAIVNRPKIKEIGIRSGEKISEEMISSSDSVCTSEFKDSYIIFPLNYLKSNVCKKFINKYNGKNVKPGFSYNSSNNKFLTIKEIKELINKV